MVKIVASGKCVNTTDEWNVVLHAGYNGSPTPADLVLLAQVAAEAWKTAIFTSPVGALISHLCTLDFVTVSQLDTAGHTVAQGVNIGAIPYAATTGSANALPSEVAVCVSNLTARTGRSYRGRSYIAGFTVGAVTPGGTMDVGAAQELATAFAGLVLEINTNGSLIAGMGTVVVGVLSTKLGISSPITLCKVGTTFDVQRRRRNSAAEVYFSASV